MKGDLICVFKYNGPVKKWSISLSRRWCNRVVNYWVTCKITWGALNSRVSEKRGEISVYIEVKKITS